MAKTEKNQNKPGKFLKKKKKRFPFFPVILLLLVAFAAIWWFLSRMDTTPKETTPGETNAPVETRLPEETGTPETSAPAVSNTSPTGPYEMPPEYQSVLDAYKQAVSEKWEFVECEENQICYMVMFHSDLSQLGYHLTDLDNDGVRELIISDGNVIYDLYTILDSEIVWVLSGGERNSYQLCLDGLLANRGSNGASSYVDNFYYLQNGQLVLKEGILFDAMSETSMWTLTGEGIEAPQPINEQRYKEILSAYQKVQIPLIPIR